jgi:hypothetical protein
MEISNSDTIDSVNSTVQFTIDSGYIKTVQ